MSSDVAVRVDGLGKDYLIGEKRARYRTLQESLLEAPSRLLRRRGAAPKESRLLTALDELGFSIGQGETVGFIGHNGAGKSTLLRILSRVTEPTRGWAEIRGRVGALLEVGTGFHPELTGRENIYLNGVILGMPKAEIARRFDDIVAFSGVERFLETPVKRFSTGMAVRLGFSVAAHMDPEVLVVDEVLAVGDAAFQRQCLDRLSQLARDGRTVLFVSHNMAVIQGLCQRGIVLERGRAIADAPIDVAVSTYLATLVREESTVLADRTDRRGNGRVRAQSLAISGEGGRVPSTGAPAVIEVLIGPSTVPVTIELAIYDQFGLPVTELHSANIGEVDRFDGAPSTFRCEIDELPLAPGRYRVDLALRDGRYWLDELQGAATFDVEQAMYGGRPVLEDSAGPVAVRHRWVSPPR